MITINDLLQAAADGSLIDLLTTDRDLVTGMISDGALAVTALVLEGVQKRWMMNRSTDVSTLDRDEIKDLLWVVHSAVTGLVSFLRLEGVEGQLIGLLQDFSKTAFQAKSLIK